MSQKAIREFDAKRMFYQWIESHSSNSGERHKNPLDEDSFSGIDVSGFVNCFADGKDLVARYHSDKDNRGNVAQQWPWLEKETLVVKPDQLVKRRGKLGLVGLRLDFDAALKWIHEHENVDVVVEGLVDQFTHFILEPFLPHDDKDEYYFNIQSEREGERLMFYEQGGVEVGDVDSKAHTLLVPTNSKPSLEEIESTLLVAVPAEHREVISKFIVSAWVFYLEYHLGYLEINPFIVDANGKVKLLDMAVKIDETAAFEVGDLWGSLDFPGPFGKKLLPEEEYIRNMDAKTGASLKLTVLKPKGRIWTMVAGGGASVVYADTIADLGGGMELANYGEYSGDPTETLTHEYAKTVLSLMTKHAHDGGKVLIIGGGIANFTNVAETFKGIVRAMRDFAGLLREHKIKVFVRRGGPNYKEGLDMMRKAGFDVGIPVDVYGPETHMVHIVKLALNSIGIGASDSKRSASKAERANLMSALGVSPKPASAGNSSNGEADSQATSTSRQFARSAPPEPVKGRRAVLDNEWQLFNRDSVSAVYGMQPRAVQGMLDFDHICARDTASVACIIFPFAGDHFQKFYWGSKEILVPVYGSMEKAFQEHPEVDSLVNFASCRSVYETTLQALRCEHAKLRTVALIAEGVPERRSRQLIVEAEKRNVMIIGPATVGGIKPGCFRIGNTGGALGNILSSKLYRPGSVAYVSRSGGMSNELNNIMAIATDGVYEGVAIGGDRFPGSTFTDHVFRFENDPNVKMIVLLGEVGGVEEYEIARAVKDGRIKKPLVAWCVGTCARIFPYSVQFGHAGALANSEAQTADAKNSYLKKCGALVPSSFDALPMLVKRTFDTLCMKGVIVVQPEPPVPAVPMDWKSARDLGLVRKPTTFMSSITDERGEELLYAGMPISKVFGENLGIGGVISLLWFRRRLPDWACKFIEMVLMLTADHGPAVAGAHNTIVTTRAGKDLVSSLCTGLLTIGPRFGGALDEAAEQFSTAYDEGLSPKDFVLNMRAQRRFIMGIGHKVRSIHNPDARVTILKSFIREHFPSTTLFDYALEVEKITTAKRPNLILNVDGAIAVAMCDLLRGSGFFTVDEAVEFQRSGVLNGLFVLARSIGFIGHHLDQVRLKQPLYRTEWDDIAYVNYGYHHNPPEKQ